MQCKVLLTILTALCISRALRAQQEYTNIVPYFLSYLWDGAQEYSNLEGQDDQVQLLKEYDFIIVGAGTAGCTLAARLSENPNWNILLLEAGGPEFYPMDIPVIAQFLQLMPEMTWQYKTQPSDKFCLGLKNNRCHFPRGKVMGGSSVLNYMMYTRGNRRDYDAWAKMGNVGWSYKEVLPYFKKLEGSLVPDAEEAYVGRNGPVKISYPKWRSPVAEAFMQAGIEDGFPQCDYNGKIQRCYSYIQTTTDQHIRWSANRAYLYPLKGKRPNLHIRKHAHVTKILVDPQTKTAYGVLFDSQGQSWEVRARKEVISSAGAINSPQLLMLSGIGPSKHLREIGIKPLVNLAVGFNLQDHFAPYIHFLTNETTLKFPDFFDAQNALNLQSGNSTLSSIGGVEAISFYDFDNPNDPDGWPNMELYIADGGFNTNPAIRRAFGLRDDVYEALYADIVKQDLNTFMILPMIIKTRSRGRIMLASKDPKKYPKIYPNFLHDPYDLDVTVKGLQKAIELMKYPAMQKINATLLDRPVPKCRKYGAITSRAYLECFVRQFTISIYHQAGTCKMGPKSDKTAVVDPRLRVHGINNLRVIDVSIMPVLVAGHPNGPTYMIAEKAADMIKQDHGFI